MVIANSDPHASHTLSSKGRGELWIRWGDPCQVDFRSIEHHFPVKFDAGNSNLKSELEDHIMVRSYATSLGPPILHHI